MEKNKIYFIIIIVLAVIIIAGIYQITGFYSDNSITGRCIDSDNGRNIYEKGITRYENRDYEYTDYCIQPGKVRESWCMLGNMKIITKTLRCPGECKDGACIK